MKQQGDGELEAGFKNLEQHIAIVKAFALPVVVAINRFPKDTDAELATMQQFCELRGAAFALSEAFAKGGEGARALAEKVVEVIEANADAQPKALYAVSYTHLGLAEDDSQVRRTTGQTDSVLQCLWPAKAEPSAMRLK